MTHGHIVLWHDGTGRDRRFSLWDLLQIVVLHRLREPFNVQAGTAAHIAREVVDAYAARADRDLAEIWAGRRIDDTDYRPMYGLTRDEDRQLRATNQGEAPDDTVMIIIPVGLLARSLFANSKIILGQRPTAGSDD